MSAFLSPSEQAVHLWDVGYIPSVCVWTVSPLSSGTTMGLDGLGCGGFGVLESCQCFSKQPG